jgi:D-inositol-3-phosphate glycosyltransferase
MKISLVGFAGSVDAPEFNAGAGPVPALAQALAEQGHEITLYTRACSRPLAVPGTKLQIVELIAGPEAELSDSEVVGHLGEFVIKLRAALRTDGAALLHSHGWLAGMATSLANRDRETPMAHTFLAPALLGVRADGRDPAVYADRLRAERAVALQADQLIATTTVERERLVQAGVPRDRIHVVPTGVHDLLAPEGIRPGAAPGEGTRRSRHFLAVVGGTRYAAATLRAVAGLANVDATYAATEATANELARLRTLHSRLNLGERVTILEAADPRRQQALLQDADLAVCLPTDEVPCFAHLEAMALGVPVIATSAEIAEAVLDGISGKHALEPRPRTLAKILHELLDDTALRQAMGLAAYDRALSRYSWPRIATELTHAYQLLV